MEAFNLVDRLHTDVLQDKYGRIEVRILRHDDSLREVHLVDVKRVSRTYALTIFPPYETRSAEILKIDSEIKAGKLIGAAFREHGYEIRKNVLDVFVIELPEGLKASFRMNDELAKVRLSEFLTRKDPEKIEHYATVFEIYHPNFRAAIISENDLRQINASLIFLEQLGVSRKSLWDVLANNNNWTDFESERSEALRRSLPQIEHYKRILKEVITSGN